MLIPNRCKQSHLHKVWSCNIVEQTEAVENRSPWTEPHPIRCRQFFFSNIFHVLLKTSYFFNLILKMRLKSDYTQIYLQSESSISFYQRPRQHTERQANTICTGHHPFSSFWNSWFKFLRISPCKQLVLLCPREISAACAETTMGQSRTISLLELTRL